MTTTLNGWDVEAMTQAIEMVKEQPEAGLVTWRGRGSLKPHRNGGTRQWWSWTDG